MIMIIDIDIGEMAPQNCELLRNPPQYDWYEKNLIGELEKKDFMHFAYYIESHEHSIAWYYICLI